jgi:hypothetical protein
MTDGITTLNTSPGNRRGREGVLLEASGRGPSSLFAQPGERAVPRIRSVPLDSSGVSRRREQVDDDCDEDRSRQG